MIIYFCRLAADLSLYFSFANSILLFFAPDQSAAFFEPIPLLLAAGLISEGLKRKLGGSPVVAAPLLLPGLILFLPYRWLLLPAAVPPWAYLIYLSYYDRGSLSHDQYYDRFFLGLKLLPLLIIPLFISLGSPLPRLFQIRILPAVVAYLFFSVLSLRLSRYRPETLKKGSAQLINFLLLAVFVLACFSIVYSHVWAILLGFFALIYHYLFAPALMLLALAITMPFFLLGRLIKLLMGEASPGESLLPAELGEFIDSGLESYSPARLPGFLRYIFLFLLGLIALYVLWRFFRRLAAGGRPGNTDPAITESRQKLESSLGLGLPLPPPADPRRAIRYYYRRFLRQGRKYGLPAEPGQTSRDIGLAAAQILRDKKKIPDGGITGQDSSGSEIRTGGEALDSLTGLRELYLPARYDDSGDSAPQREDAVKARNHSRAVIKALSGKGANN